VLISVETPAVQVEHLGLPAEPEPEPEAPPAEAPPAPPSPAKAAEPAAAPAAKGMPSLEVKKKAKGP
jgi:hypothetical protein